MFLEELSEPFGENWSKFLTAGYIVFWKHFPAAGYLDTFYTKYGISKDLRKQHITWTYLLEANIFGILPKASATHVKPIFSDEAMVVETNTAEGKMEYFQQFFSQAPENHWSYHY